MNIFNPTMSCCRKSARDERNFDVVVVVRTTKFPSRMSIRPKFLMETFCLWLIQKIYVQFLKPIKVTLMTKL